MKYCPYCSADLLGAEISFCSECGKALPDSVHPRSDKQNTAKVSESESEKKKGRKPAKNKKAPKHSKRSARIKEEPVDDGYDGYYDDVQPLDAGTQKEGIDRVLMKKIILLICGLALAIVVSIAVMYLL